MAPVFKQRFETLGFIGHQTADPQVKKPDHLIGVVYSPHMYRPTERVAVIEKALIYQSDSILPDWDLDTPGTA